jgi:hypothetical protein
LFSFVTFFRSPSELSLSVLPADALALVHTS